MDDLSQSYDLQAALDAGYITAKDENDAPITGAEQTIQHDSLGGLLGSSEQYHTLQSLWDNWYELGSVIGLGDNSAGPFFEIDLSGSLIRILSDTGPAEQFSVETDGIHVKNGQAVQEFVTTITPPGSDNKGVTEKAVVDILGDAVIFGTQFQSAVSEAQSSTTSATFIQKLKLTTPTIPAGDYRIGWYFEWTGEDENANYRYRVQVDDTTTLMDITSARKKKFSDGAWGSWGGFQKVTLTNASHFIDIDYTAIGGLTAYIRRARIEIWRVA